MPGHQPTRDPPLPVVPLSGLPAAALPFVRVVPWKSLQGVSARQSPVGTRVGCRSQSSEPRASIFLRPFAPPALPGFIATMDALTPAGRSCVAWCLGQRLPLCPPFRAAWQMDARPCPLRRRYRPDPRRSLCVMCLAFRPFRLQPPDRSRRRFDTLPLSATGFRGSIATVRVSPLNGRLTRRPGRIEFTRRLRTGRSPPGASHPASLRRSTIELQAGECVPEEDLHLSDQTHLQTHRSHAERGNEVVYD